MESAYFIEKSVGITVIHLRAAYYEENQFQSHPPMDYHIHNLLYYDRDLKHAGAICLDMDLLQTAPCPDESGLNDTLKNLNTTIAELFIDKIDSMIKAARYSPELLFQRSEQELWNEFNRLKEDTFMEKLPRLVAYLEAKGAVIKNETEVEIQEVPDVYKWAEITFSEERISRERAGTPA